MSSLASLTPVMDSMKSSGTAVVNQGREDTAGMVCQKWQQGLKVEEEGEAGESGWRLYLEDQQQQEVDVCQPPELLQQVERQEGEQVVPGGLDGIVLDQRSGRVK